VTKDQAKAVLGDMEWFINNFQEASMEIDSINAVLNLTVKKPDGTTEPAGLRFPLDPEVRAALIAKLQASASPGAGSGEGQ
jgi:hypothetical protein